MANQFENKENLNQENDANNHLDRSDQILETDDNLVNDEIEILRQEILEEKEKNKSKKKLIKKQTFRTCKKKQNIEQSTDDSITSVDCEQEEILFRLMDDEKKRKHIKQVWIRAWVKARAGSHVIRLFSDLHRQIILFGASNQMDFLQKESSIEKIILMPDGKFAIAWNLLLICLLLYIALAQPFVMAFMQIRGGNQENIDWVIDGLFMVDVLLAFITAFEEKDGTIQHRHNYIARRYIRTWFFYDAIACFPFHQISLGANNLAFQRLLRLVKLPRLLNNVSIFDLLRQFSCLNKSKAYIRLEKKYRTNNAIVRQCVSMLASFIITHIFGCFWYLSAKLDQFNPDTWVYRMGLVDEDITGRYIFSYYWASQTVATLGYGDIPAVTVPEMILSLVWMLVGVGFYSFVVGNFSSILTGNVEIEATIQMKINSLKELARKAEFPLELLFKTQAFIQNNYETLYNQDEEAQLIKDLPPSLRDEVFSNTYGAIVDKIKFFSDIADPDFLWRILPLLRPVKLEKDDVLYWDGDLAEDIYFILKGHIRLYSKRGNPFLKYSEGDMFGDCDTLLNLPRVSKAIAETNLQIMVLKVDKLFEESFSNQQKNLLQMIFNARKKRNYHLQLIRESNNKQKLAQKERLEKDIRNKAALALNGAFGIEMLKQFGLKHQDAEGLSGVLLQLENNRPSLFEKIKSKIFSTFNATKQENENKRQSGGSSSGNSFSPRSIIAQSIHNALLSHGLDNNDQINEKMSASPASVPRNTYAPIIYNYFKSNLALNPHQTEQIDPTRRSMNLPTSPRITVQPNLEQLRLPNYDLSQNKVYQHVSKKISTNIKNNIPVDINKQKPPPSPSHQRNPLSTLFNIGSFQNKIDINPKQQEEEKKSIDGDGSNKSNQI